MKKVLRKALVMVLATAMLVTCSEMRMAHAMEYYDVASTGGSYGTMYYNLSTEDDYYYIGTTMYRLKATSIQTLPNGGAYVPISSITYNAVIYLEAGGTSSSSASFTYRDASWCSNGVEESAVTSSVEKGYVRHSITSNNYGSITKVVPNY